MSLNAHRLTHAWKASPRHAHLVLGKLPGRGGSGWKSALGKLALGLGWFLQSVFYAPSVPAQQPEVEVLLPQRECQVKYAFLYSFGLLTNWPVTALDPASDQPFIIGVLGEKSFPADLNRIAETKKIQGLPVVIKRYQIASEIGPCHILYLTEGVSLVEQMAALKRVFGKPVLTVGEMTGLDSDKVVMKYVIEQGTIKFIYHAEIARQQQVTINPRLIKLSKIIPQLDNKSAVQSAAKTLVVP